MASDKQVASARKGNAISSFLLVAALVAAGGVGRFLWKYQARLDHDTPASVAVAPATATVPLPEPAAKSPPPLHAARVRPLVAAPAPAPNAVPIPIYAGSRTHHRDAVAPAAAQDFAARDVYAGGPSHTPSEDPKLYTSYDPTRGSSSGGSKVYTSRDPNASVAPAPTRPGTPRYYNYDSRQWLPENDDAAFRRRTIVK